MALIISLCDQSGVWSDPYRHDHEVITVDLEHGQDIRLFEFQDREVEGIIAQPPCCHLAQSGAPHWESKGEEALLKAMQLVDACLRIIVAHKPKWWVLENPRGRLVNYLGPPVMKYSPWEYALWADKPRTNAYTKPTYLWGNFNTNLLGCPLVPEWDNRYIQNMAHSKDRKRLRSVTPQGFARAFYMANNAVQINHWPFVEEP
jgi:hypothetical protein